MINSQTNIDLNLHECSSAVEMTQRITDYLLATSRELFYDTDTLAGFRVFTTHTDFIGFTFHDHAIKLADLEGPCNNPEARNASLPNMKEDYSYAFIPCFVPPRSDIIMPISVIVNFMSNLEKDGFHLAFEHGQYLFGKKFS